MWSKLGLQASVVVFNLYEQDHLLRVCSISCQHDLMYSGTLQSMLDMRLEMHKVPQIQMSFLGTA